MKFATKQIFELTEIDYIKLIEPFFGNHFELRDDPSGLHFCNNNGKNSLRSFIYPNDFDLKNKHIAKELTVDSSNTKDAQLISELVNIGCLLGYPSLQDYPTPSFVVNINEKDEVNNSSSKKLKKKYYEEYYAQEPIRSNLYLGCLIASKSFNNLKYIYMLNKYRLSLKLSSLSPHSLHPRHGDVFSGYENDYEFHVSGAYAFLSAYSIIEDLKVDIKSSKDNQRIIINNGINLLNPKIIEDTIYRLKEKNIDGDELISFVVRGENRNLTSKVSPAFGTKSSFNAYNDVHDIDLSIVEAIHYCSYIRNYFLAHGFSEENSYLSPYDIHNVQMLVRRLLLSHFDCWKGGRRKR